jgi:hypothetical protein
MATSKQLRLQRKAAREKAHEEREAAERAVREAEYAVIWSLLIDAGFTSDQATALTQLHLGVF